MDLSIRVAFSAIDKLTRPVNAASKAIGGLSDSLKKTQSSIKDLEKSAAAFDKLRSQANETAQKLKTTQRAFDGLNQKQREGGQLTEAQAARLESLRGKLSRLTDTYNKQTTQLRTAAQAVRQHGVNLSSGSGAIQSAIRRTEQYNQTLERERRQLAATTRAQASYERAKETAGKLRGAGMGMTLGAAATGYAAGSFLAPAVGFDEEMSRVQALTRLSKNSSQLADLRAQAKKLGAETAFTSRDAASGQAFLAMAGFTPEAIQAALPGVLNMALAGGMDLGESADISSNILSQFRLDPKEMDRVSDVLTAAFTRTNTDLTNIGEAMKYAGTGMAGLGVDVERTTAMIGVMANVGLRGSIAGTGLQTTFSRLAAPTTKAQAALKQLGVTVADATGKMRPAEAILSDIYKSVSKYGDTDQLSFFKDIAGEEAAKSFQALVRSAGSGELQKLLTDLRGSQGEAQKAAKVMADNLSGDLKNLDSAWEGFRIQVEETTDGPLRKLTQGLSDLITSASEWVKENPRLTQTLILVGGALTVFAGAIGIASIAASFILGPLAKLRLILSMIGISSITATGGISTLGMAFSGLRVILASLLTIPGAILAAFVIAGVLIWKYWEPIKAFFSGFFSGIWQALTPLRSAFAPLIPVFSAIGDGIKSVWEWFKNLLSPMETSKETLDKCASAGETFGRVMGTALSILLWPLQQLMNGVSWLLEKLDLIPEGIDRARQQADKAQQDLEASATALAGHQLPLGQATVSGTSGGGKPPKLTGDNGTLRRLNNIVDNTKATADNTKEARKKIGPGDITFKNLPRALALRGAYQEARISPQAIPRVAAPAAGGILSVPSAKQGPLSAPVSAPTNGAPVFNLIFNEVGQHSARDLERMVRNAVRDAMASTTRSNRGSFRDRD
ncbi:phage tail tape measure protein [Klebsiella aerogenes]|uniref:phage tail tape measure protein n=3 Tax=Klebsiella aerogenes TaxID=548 RepID=UPI00277B7799|nr:phage tail tape measure protein [Klebsiella aerogenes]HDS6698419.1 phage tail tape measure protein [Klebsiella aerogenes]HDT0439650.1 phage tail tape measure protein [Klebsiella aerogenes]HDT4803030.1 phage tail tape measure protein [Klebsiella aerogenes]HDU3728486.1 phage tail tape measure protein [Klebsiella aerogenes]